MKLTQRALHLFTAVDQLIYVLITLGKGYPDESLSSAAYRLELRGAFWGKVWRPVIDWLLAPLEKNHCQQAYNAEKRRLQHPPELS